MMDVKISKTNTSADGVIERPSSTLDEVASKTLHYDEDGDW